MLTEQGTVVALGPEGVRVAVSTRTACQSCQSKTLCGQGVLNQVVPQKTAELRRPVNMPLCVGDTVLIGMQEQAVLKSALIMYLLPVLLTLLGAGLADAWAGHRDGWTVLGALFGLALGFGGMYRYGQEHQHDERYQACILAILNPDSSPLKYAESGSSQLTCPVAADKQDGG